MPPNSQPKRHKMARISKTEREMLALTREKLPAPPVVPLVTQHLGPTSPRVVRMALRRVADAYGVPLIQALLTDETAEDKTRLQAADIALRYGIGSATALLDADGENVPVHGVIALPALALQTVQVDAQRQRKLSDAVDGVEADPIEPEAA